MSSNVVALERQVETKRVFVTVELKESTAQQVGALVANLRDNFPLDRKQLDSVVRWVEPGAMHITLHTLEVQVSHLDQTQELLTRVVRELDLASFNGSNPSALCGVPQPALMRWLAAMKLSALTGGAVVWHSAHRRRRLLLARGKQQLGTSSPRCLAGTGRIRRATQAAAAAYCPVLGMCGRGTVCRRAALLRAHHVGED